MQKHAIRVQMIESTDFFSLKILRQFLDEAFEHNFSNSDFDNALGGVHFIIEQNAKLMAHGSVVKRAVALDGLTTKVSYVEAVAVASMYRGLGYGQMVMDAISRYCLEKTAISLLSSEEHGFYAQFGWSPLGAKSFAMTSTGLVATPTEDDHLMFLAKTPKVAPFETIVALDRPTYPW